MCNSSKGTYDLQNVVAISQLPGQISVTGELISGATATGVLVVVYSLTNSEDIHYIIEQAKGDRISLNVTGLTGAEYGVSTFALENGLPLPSVVASPKIIVVLNSHQGWWISMHCIIISQGLFIKCRRVTRAATTYRIRTCYSELFPCLHHLYLPGEFYN